MKKGEKSPERKQTSRVKTHNDELTFIIAHKRFVESKKVEDIAAEVGLDARSVRRRLKDAQARGLVHILIVPPIHHERLTKLQTELRYGFELKEAIVLPGLEDVMEKENIPDKEAIVIACCRAAADYLAASLKDGNTLAVPWGRIASYVTTQLTPRRSLKNLLVVPFVGVMGVRTNPYEANTIAAKMASSLGGEALLLAAPAVVEVAVYENVVQLPLVKDVLNRVKRADVVLTPIAAANARTSTIVRMGLAKPADVSEMISRGAVGEIASHWWFDRYGKEIPRPQFRPVGLGLEGLKEIVRRGGRVVAVVAASRDRIVPLKVALEQNFVNVLVTDHVTARELLQD